MTASVVCHSESVSRRTKNLQFRLLAKPLQTLRCAQGDT
jgi:hypothetical protein